MIKLELDKRELTAIEMALKERPAQASRALVRAINKTLTWAGSQGLRAIAQANAIPLGSLRGGRNKGRRGRSRIFPAKRNYVSGLLWLGTGPIKASYLKPLRQQPLGAMAGKHFFKGSFVAKMPTGHIGIFGRKGASRLPLREEYVRLTAAEKALDGVHRNLSQRLETVFAQEFNYEVNVRGRA